MRCESLTETPKSLWLTIEMTLVINASKMLIILQHVGMVLSMIQSFFGSKHFPLIYLSDKEICDK